MNAINAKIYTSFSICMNNVQVVSSKRILWHINDCICNLWKLLHYFWLAKVFYMIYNNGLLKSLESLS